MHPRERGRDMRPALHAEQDQTRPNQKKTKPRQEPNETKQEEAKTGGDRRADLSLLKEKCGNMIPLLGPNVPRH